MTDLAADGAHAAPPAPDTSHLPLMLAPDAGADAAVMAAEVEAMADAGQDAGEGGHSSGGDGDGTLEDLHLLQALEGAQGGLGLPPDSTLDHALEAVDLEGLTADQVAELESGDADRMAAVLQVKEAPAGRGTGDGSGLNRVSIKALPPAARLKLVEAISRVRDGGDFEAALREAFPPRAAGGGGCGGLAGAGRRTPGTTSKRPRHARARGGGGGGPAGGAAPGV